MFFIPFKYKRQEGFTLLEVVIALFIFVIGILGVLAMQIRSIQGNSSGQRLTEAAAQAQEVLESITQRPYADFAPGLPTTTQSGNYSITQTVAEIPGSPLKKEDALWITVVVNWQEGSGPVRIMSISFIKSKTMESSYAI